jgi:hypothetical protein
MQHHPRFIQSQSQGAMAIIGALAMNFSRLFSGFYLPDDEVSRPGESRKPAESTHNSVQGTRGSARGIERTSIA